MTTKELKELASKMPNISFVPAGYEFWKEELLRRIINIFTYDNLPDTCNMDVLRRQLMYGKLANGCSIFTKADDGNIYNLDGTPYGTGPYSSYGVFPSYTLSVDSLRISKKGELGKDGEVVYNDSLKIGLQNIIDRYARMLADEDSTFSKILYNMRRPNYFNAPDETVAKSIKAAMDDNELGIDRIVLGKDIMSEASVLSNAPGSYGNGVLTEHIMAKNGIINQFMRELGIPCVDEKKERINEDELTYQNSGLSIIYDMLNTQSNCFEKVNTLFDTNIIVRISDEWAWILEKNTEEAEDEAGTDELEDAPMDDANEGENQEPIPETMEEDAPEEDAEESAEDAMDQAEPEAESEIIEEVAEDIIEAVEDIIEEDTEEVEE